ncbi:MAG: ImmA/IrrE family metallo-endopeptidase, partial [Ignavibacteriales bacterium]|nr:ImmA/IrrE family metallo-endopeptidase [Ignavibacteriales bacterium]
MSDFLKEEGRSRLNFIGRYTLSTPVKQVAGDIRRELQINSIPKNTDALKHWIEKAEARGIFIAISGNVHSRMLIDIEEVRGFAITDPYAPYIFLNGKDYLNSQLFTLVHELAHLWLNSTGVSNINIEDETSSTDNDEIELYCNRVAAETLMPEKQLLEALPQDAALITMPMIENLAKMFSVSRLAMLVRLFQMTAINFKTYSILKVQAEKQFQEFLEHTAK